MDLSTGIGRDEPGHRGFRAAGRFLGAAFALVSLTACSTSPAASAPLVTLPASALPCCPSPQSLRPSQLTPTPPGPALVLPTGVPPTSWSRVADAPLLHVSPASNTAVATAPDGTFVALASVIDSRKAPVVLHSMDGLTWTAGGSLPASGDTQVSAIARWGDLLVAVGEDTTALWAAMAKGEATDARPAGAAWTSTDGTTWQRVPDQPAFEPSSSR